MSKDGGPDGSPCAQFKFKGSVDGTLLEKDWTESSSNFYATFKTSIKPGDFDGLSLSLKPAGINEIEIYLAQEKSGEQLFYGLVVTLNEGQWQDYKIPFSCFYNPDVQTPIDRAKPINISITVSYYHNFQNYYLREKEYAAELLVDNIGLFKIKGTEEPAIVESWNDEVNRLSFKIELQSATFWQDYSLIEGKSEEEAAKIDSIKKVPGIKRELMTITRPKGTQTGNALEVVVSLEVEKAFINFLDANPQYEMELSLYAQPGKMWKGYTGVSYFFRSENIGGGSLAVEYKISPERELWFNTSIEAGEYWSRMRIPFDQFKLDEENSLATFTEWTLTPRLYFNFGVPAAVLEQSIKDGKIRIAVGFDDFVLEK